MPFRSTLTLTHYGRKTGKPYRVKLWYVPMGEEIWVGSLDATRAWVRNVRARGRAEIDLGEGPRTVTCRAITGRQDRERLSCAIQARHPIMSRILRYFVRGERCGFSLCFAETGRAQAGEREAAHDRSEPRERDKTRGRRRAGRRGKRAAGR